MTTRCLIAFDNADLRAQNVLRKHAQKRPLGDIESKHRYHPSQPVLSCRTVDIDLSGTRTYRAKSTTDIISEQHRYIHDLYNKARNIASAPPRRLQSASRYSQKENYQKLHKLHIEVNARPYSSLSQSSKLHSRPKHSAKSKRPKTTGNLSDVKSSTDSFMIVKVDPDYVETSRAQQDIAEQIRQHWLPENNNLNQGKFIRGQKKPEAVPASVDAWLTFGGAQGDTDQGLVDVFANYQNEEEYYNIDGSIGSRVAQQLHRGDKIRIGINGVVQSNDLKVRKKSGVKRAETASTRKSLEEGKKENTEVEKKPEPETKQSIEDENPEDFDFCTEIKMDFLSEDLEDIMEVEKETKPTIPLCWSDQVNNENVRIISPRLKMSSREMPNLCETHPVVFERLSSESAPASRPWQPHSEGYQVKYRHRPQIHSLDTKESRLSRVKVISIDPRSKEEEEQLNNISVDEILKSAVEKKSSRNQDGSKSSESEHSKRSESRADDVSTPVTSKLVSSPRGVESAPSQISTELPRKRLQVQSHAPSTTVQDLSIVSPGLKQKVTDTRSVKSSGKAVVGKGLIRSPLGGSGPSIKVGGGQGETEYIQIASKLHVPNNIQSQRPVMSYTHQMGSSQDRVTSPERGYVSRTGQDPQNEEASSLVDDGGGAAPSLASPETKSPVPALEINIPTADDMSDRESLLPSPQRRGSFLEDEDLTVRQRREASMRDHQINQIASMLGDALISQK